MPSARRVSIDGFVHRPAQPLSPRPNVRPKLQPKVPLKPVVPQTRQTTPRPVPQPVTAKKPRPRVFAPPVPAEKPGLWQRIQLPLVIVVGLIIGFFMQSLTFGIALIALYGVLAVICRVQSRVTFVLSFLSLVATVLLLLVKRNPEQSGNFATYTFLLLVVAVISLLIESKPTRPHYKRR